MTALTVIDNQATRDYIVAMELLNRVCLDLFKSGNRNAWRFVHHARLHLGATLVTDSNMRTGATEAE
jgi:hypothetical protein